MFSQILGHPQIVNRLCKAIHNPGHAYVLVGEKGLGKLALARAFTKSLQCEANKQDGDSCGVCLSCRVFESDNHPDVLYVQATKTKIIGVEDVRTQILLPMSEKPFRYPYKIFIVNQVLTTQAQSALLKTIEEPAPFGIFLFLTEHTRLFLSTLLSRCVTFKLNPMSDEDVAKIVSKKTSDPAVIFAQGNPGRAKALIESKDFEEMQNLAFSVASNIYDMDIVEIFRLCAKFEKWKESIQTLLNMLYMHYRERLNKPASQPCVHTILSGLEAITKVKRNLSQNGHFQMNIETMLLKLSRIA